MIKSKIRTEVRASKYNIKVGDTVTLTFHYKNLKPPLEFFWSGTDGESGSTQSITHTYTKTGLYEPLCTFIDFNNTVGTWPVVKEIAVRKA